MTSISHLPARVFAFAAGGIALYAAMAALTGWDDLQRRFADFPWIWAPVLILLSGLNYALRFLRWELYLRRLEIRIPRRESAAIFFATLLMVVTPGKVGEVFKAALLRQRHGVSLAVGLPVLLAERILDLLAVVLLALGGLLTWRARSAGLVAGILAAAAITLLPFALRSPRLRRALGRRFERLASRTAAGRLDHESALDATAKLLDGRTAAAGLLLSLPAWACEGLELALVCRALEEPVGVTASLFAYAAGTLVGALSFLPGGIGGTEAVMIGLLGTAGMTTDAAVAATFVVRAATLWLAVVVGMTVFLAARRLLSGETPPRPVSR